MELTADDPDELIDFWTLLDEDRELLAGKRGAPALGFALLLKHYSRHGRFPRSRSELSDGVIVFVAGQLSVDASDLGFYEWSGSTIEYHRAQIRDHLGYRLATVADQDRLTVWLTESVAHAERRVDRVREELLAEFRRERVEPPTSGRIVRMVRSALRTAEQNWASRIAGRLDPPVVTSIDFVRDEAFWPHSSNCGVADTSDSPLTCSPTCATSHSDSGMPSAAYMARWKR